MEQGLYLKLDEALQCQGILGGGKTISFLIIANKRRVAIMERTFLQVMQCRFLLLLNYPFKDFYGKGLGIHGYNYWQIKIELPCLHLEQKQLFFVKLVGGSR